jgi:hypothetical protein
VRGDGQTLHFHAIDAHGEWLARCEGDMVQGDTHIEADVAGRGPATRLPFVVSRRRSLDAAPALEVEGDHALLDLWIEHMDWVTDWPAPVSSRVRVARLRSSTLGHSHARPLIGR